MKIQKFYNRLTGFTLIETLIYSALVLIIISFSIFATYQIIESGDRGKNLRELAENQKFLEQKIFWALQSVSVINEPLNGATSTVLSVNKIGFAENPIVIDSADNAARLKRGSSPIQMITDDFVAVQNLTFHQYDFSGRPAIKIEGVLFNNLTLATASVNAIIIVQ